jgi:hypothetical protein
VVDCPHQSARQNGAGVNLLGGHNVKIT